MILDSQGKPFSEKLLESTQTDAPELAWLKRTFQNHPSRGLTPARLAQILEDAEHFNIIDQSELWLDMREKWGHLDAEMSKRERAILTLDWDIKPPENANRAERKAADFCREVLQSLKPNPLKPGHVNRLSMRNVLLNCTDAIGHGFSCQEMSWQLDGGVRKPAQIIHRPHSWFKLDQLTHSEIRLRSTNPEGEELQPYGWIVHSHQARAGFVSRGGLVRSLAWPYIFANYSIRDLAELLEILGIPPRIGKYPAQATREDKNKLLQAVSQLGHSSGGIIPDTMAIEILNAIAQGNGEAFKLMIDWAEDTASKIITGQSLGDGKTATHSLERSEIRHYLLETDARQIEPTINAFLLWPLTYLNGHNVEFGRSPQLVFDTQESEDIKMLADALPKLVAVGTRIPLHYVNDKTKIPIPTDGDPILEAQAASVIPNIDITTENSVNKPTPVEKIAAAKAGIEQDRLPVSDYTEQLANEAAPVLGEWIDTIREAVAAAKSLPDLRDTLLRMYPALDSKKMADVMAVAFSTARLAGRFDVKQENHSLGV
ncbi:MAG: DUF935 domain-containing protein [Candidatus Methylumidiphilus sp.]